MKQAAICILDGMGPQAGGYLYNTIIQKAVRDYGAKNNDDFPEIILYSVPVPDFISNNRSKDRTLKMLQAKVRETNKLEISCISIACNTAHILLEQLQKETDIPFVSIIEETIKGVKKDKVSVVGLMGTPSTLRFGFYQEELKKEGIKCIVPSKAQIIILERVTRNIIAGKVLQSDQSKLISIADSFKKKGARAIILGCTELPLGFPKKYSLPIYNSVEELCKALLRIYYGSNTIQK
ncbi:MAG: aspartate racemase [Microgenomates group bacterium Gr01-1014_7]|nr:MAG: aspartate racemase [Microgenomates group bacterium Gr01-1014_7]